VTEQRFDRGAQVVIPKTARQMGERAERLEQRHHARIAEAQGGDALAVFDGCRFVWRGWLAAANLSWTRVTRSREMIGV